MFYCLLSLILIIQQQNTNPLSTSTKSETLKLERRIKTGKHLTVIIDYMSGVSIKETVDFQLSADENHEKYRFSICIQWITNISHLEVV